MPASGRGATRASNRNARWRGAPSGSAGSRRGRCSPCRCPAELALDMGPREASAEVDVAQVGDRVEVRSAQVGPRAGVVVGVTGSLVRVRWDTGGETAM